MYWLHRDSGIIIDSPPPTSMQSDINYAITILVPFYTHEENPGNDTGSSIFTNPGWQRSPWSVCGDRTTNPTSGGILWEMFYNETTIGLNYRSGSGSAPGTFQALSGPVVVPHRKLCMFAYVFDPSTTSRLYVFSEDQQEPIGFVDDNVTPASLAQLSPDAGFAFGSAIPTTNLIDNSHAGISYPFVIRKGAMSQADLEAAWGEPGQQSIGRLLPSDIPNDLMVFAPCKMDDNFRNPMDDDLIFAYFEGDTALAGANWWDAFDQRANEWRVDGVVQTQEGRSTLLVVGGGTTYTSGTKGASPIASSLIEDLPYQEDESHLSFGKWTYNGIDSLAFDDTPVPGSLPKLGAVLAGNRSESRPLFAIGFGNSRWTNLSGPVPRSTDNAAILSRNHMMGLMESAPAGVKSGLMVPNSDQGLDVIEGYVGIKTGASVGGQTGNNRTRIATGTDTASSLGQGTPMGIGPSSSFEFRFDAGGTVPTTKVLALILKRPGPCEITCQATTRASYDATAGANVSGVSETVDLDTKVYTGTYLSGSDPITVSGTPESSGLQGGDMVVIETASSGGDDMSQIDSVGTGSIDVGFAFTVALTAADPVHAGPWEYQLVELEIPSGNDRYRGMRITHNSGIRAIVAAVGYYDAGNPGGIVFHPAGKGGQGYDNQATINFDGWLPKYIDGLGIELVIAGFATQGSTNFDGLVTQLDSKAAVVEVIGSPDISNSSSTTFGNNVDSTFHQDLIDEAGARPNWAYRGTNPTSPRLEEQWVARWRQEAVHANGFGMLKAGELWWDNLSSLAIRSAGASPYRNRLRSTELFTGRLRNRSNVI